MQTNPANGEPFWETVERLKLASEAEVEQCLIVPLLAALGYSPSEISPKAPIVFQEGRKGRKHEADFVVHDGDHLNENTSLIVVEAKTPGENLADAKRQAESYAHATRAPFLVLTDGSSFEIWQMQTAGQSEQVLACSVTGLLSHRGLVERLIGRGAAIAHCRALKYKPLTAAADDISGYVQRELTRLADAHGIARRVQVAGSPTPAIAALKQSDRGAIVLAPSGFGKSTLATELHRSCLSTLGASESVSFLISVPDLANLNEPPEDYARNRLAAACPHFASTQAFSDLLESRGARLICDGLDRIGQTAQAKFLSTASALLRDRPKVSIVILGRIGVPNSLALPILELLPLNRSEQQELAAHASASFGAVTIHSVPSALAPLAEHPLLLTLLLQYRNKTGSLPDRLEDLFEAWLKKLLEADGHGAAAVAQMRKLLTKFAVVLAGRTRPHAEVFAEVQLDSEATLDALVRSGALILGGRVELLHDALGDYLRAEALSALTAEEFETRLGLEHFTPGSLFAALLMSKCRTAQRRALIWDKLGQAGLDIYLDVLRFGGEPDVTADTEEEVSAAYVQEFREGIVQPARMFMAPLEIELNTALAWQKTDQLGVRGSLTPDRKTFRYEFYPATPADRLTQGGTSGSYSPGGGFSLERSVGGKNARRMGFDKLSGALTDVILMRRLEGGPEWVNERLLGRLRFAYRQWKVDAPLDLDFANLILFLESYRPYVLHMNGSSNRGFSIDDMLADVSLLKAWGRKSAEPWWQAYGTDPTEGEIDIQRIGSLLDEFWRRSQTVYREIVDNSFRDFRSLLDFNNAMPVRYKGRVWDPPNWFRGLAYTWRPVATWEDAGGDVELGSEGLFRDEAYSEVMAQLASLGRSGCTSVSFVQGSMPTFDGSHRNRSFDGETAVLRFALGLLTNDLDRLLGRLGSGISLGFQCALD